MMSEELNVGDKVRLKTGHTFMTIAEVTGSQAVCFYQEKNKIIQEKLPLVVLTKQPLNRGGPIRVF